MHGSTSYYWFWEDGTLAGTGWMNTGHRCALVDAEVGFGPEPREHSEIHVILKFNTRGFMIARYVLGKEGLELVSLMEANGTTRDNSGYHVGDSLLELRK